jgi:hypothetical protein
VSSGQPAEEAGQRVQRVGTGSQVSNLVWARDSSELVSFLHTKTMLSLATEMVLACGLKPRS